MIDSIKYAWLDSVKLVLSDCKTLSILLQEGLYKAAVVIVLFV
ncbi:hypothetical protein [Bartonella sp. ML70XJBT]|nr:hypothetical protein [Bartonella sp. ML70XJBT]